MLRGGFRTILCFAVHALASAHTFVISAFVAVAAAIPYSIITVMSIPGSITAERISS